MSFYGDIVSTGDSPFVFDRVYSSRYQMERSMAEDGVFVGRYVLINYDKTYTANNFREAYRDIPLDRNAKNITLYNDTTCSKPIRVKSNNEGEELSAYIDDIFYVIDGETYSYYRCTNASTPGEIALFDYYDQLNYSWNQAYFDNRASSTGQTNAYYLFKDPECTNYITRKTSPDDEQNVEKGDIVFVREYDKEVSEKEKAEGYYTFYECKRTDIYLSEADEEVALFERLQSVLGKGSEESFENYLINQRIDYLKYGISTGQTYDKTVWQKTYVGNKEKYMKVAELNSKAPELFLSLDPPTVIPKAPYFAHNIGEGNSLVKDLHIQPTWGLRVRAANKALSLDGQLLPNSNDTGNYLSYTESLKKAYKDFTRELCNIERIYEDYVASAKSNFFDIKNSKIHEFVDYYEDYFVNYNVNDNNVLYNDIDSNINEILEYYIKSPEANYPYKYKINDVNHTFYIYYRPEIDFDVELEPGDLITEQENLWLKEGYLNNNPETLAILQEIIDALKNYCDINKDKSHLYNEGLCTSILSNTNQIANIISKTFQGISINSSYIKSSLEILVQPVIELKIQELAETVQNIDNSINELIDVQISDLIEFLDEEILLTDETTVWKTPNNYYFDGQNWVTDESEFAGDIYYNRDGFDSQFTVKSNIPNAITITPTGFSQTIDDNGTVLNKSYYDPWSDNAFGETIEAPDTQEISIHLPVIGNTISDVWDIIYGEGKPNEDGDLERNRNISWDEDGETVERNRLVNLTSDQNFTYNTESLSTVAGAINSMQDLMGKIIVDDLTITKNQNGELVEQTYTQARTVPSDDIRDYVDSNNIYYFSLDGLYYKATSKYDFKENCYPIDQWDNQKSKLITKDLYGTIHEIGENDEFDPTAVYYLKNSPEEKVLIYDYIKTREEYERDVQGYTPIPKEQLHNPDEMPHNLYFLNYNTGSYLYRKKYRKDQNYFELTVQESPFDPAEGEFRRDENGNLFNDRARTDDQQGKYQWRGQNYYQLGEYVNNIQPGHMFIPNKYYVNTASDGEEPRWNALVTRTFDPDAEYYALPPMVETTPITRPDGSTVYIVSELGQPKKIDNILSDQIYDFYIKTEDLNIAGFNGNLNLLEPNRWKITLEPVDEEDAQVPGFRKVKEYSDLSTDDNTIEPPIFYGIPKAIFEDAETVNGETEDVIINESAVKPVEKYKPGVYYYQADSGEGNNTVNYYLDKSDKGSAETVYYKIDAVNVNPLVYQPGTIYYRQFHLQQNGKIEYILSNQPYDDNETYYIHNTYYVTDNYDSYRTGQIWDYTLPWSSYILDNHNYRDTINYMGSNENWIDYSKLYREGEQGDLPSVLHRPYYYDSEGHREVHWREDFEVLRDNQFFAANNSYVQQKTTNFVEGRTYYYDSQGKREAIFYEPGKYFYRNPNTHWFVKDNNNQITNGRKYFYDKDGENEVLFKERFSSIINNNNIYYYNTTDNYEQVSAASPDGNTTYVYDDRFNYYVDNQGDTAVYFKELWNEYLTLDDPRYNFYIPNFEKEISNSLVVERNYYQNDLERTKIHLNDADWLRYNNRYEDYEEGYYDYVLDENNEVTMGRQYYIMDNNRYVPVKYVTEQYPQYKTDLWIYKDYQIADWTLDSHNVATESRNYFTNNTGTNPAYLWEQFERLTREKTIYTRTAHSVDRYVIDNGSLNVNRQYYSDEGSTKVYFGQQYPNFGNQTDVLKVYDWRYVSCQGNNYVAGNHYYTFDGTNYNEELYLEENFDTYINNLEVYTTEDGWVPLTTQQNQSFDSTIDEANGYRLMSTQEVVHFIAFDDSTMYEYKQVWSIIDKNNPNPASYNNALSYRLNDVDISIIGIYTTGTYYYETRETEYRYEPVAAGSSPDETKTYYLNQSAMPFVHYQANTFYFWNNAARTERVRTFISSDSSDIPDIQNITYYDKDSYNSENPSQIIFKSFSDYQMYYYDTENMQYKALTLQDLNNTLDRTKNYYYDGNYNNRIDFRSFNDIKNNCYYYNDESQLNTDYLLQTGTFDNSRTYYYIFTPTGVQGIQFISTSNFPGSGTYYLLDNDDANRQKYILCTSGIIYDASKKYFKLTDNIYYPILFQGWIANKYYYQDDTQMPLTLALDAEMQNTSYYADVFEREMVDVRSNPYDLYYNNLNETNFRAVQRGFREDSNNLTSITYYIKLTDEVVNQNDTSLVRYKGSDKISDDESNKHYIKKIAAPAGAQDYVINGYYYYDYTGYELELSDNFDYTLMPRVVQARNEQNQLGLYVEYKLVNNWQADTYYYSNDYAESIQSCKLVSKDVLDEYKKYYFEELVGFSKNYNTVNGLILQFNKLLGNDNTDSRDLNTLYGTINRLNDEIRRLRIYDYSTVNNIISSIEYSYNTITAIHKQLKSLQDQAAGEEGDLLTEYEAAVYYPNVLNLNTILGIDYVADIGRNETRVIYRQIPENGTAAEYPKIQGQDGYYHIIGRDASNNPIYEMASFVKNDANFIQLLGPKEKGSGYDLNFFNGLKHVKQNDNFVDAITELDTALATVEDDYLTINKFKNVLGITDSEYDGQIITINNPDNGGIVSTNDLDNGSISGNIKTLFNELSSKIYSNYISNLTRIDHLNEVLFGDEEGPEDCLDQNKEDGGIFVRIAGLETMLKGKFLGSNDEFNQLIQTYLDEHGFKPGGGSSGGGGEEGGGEEGGETPTPDTGAVSVVWSMSEADKERYGAELTGTCDRTYTQSGKTIKYTYTLDLKIVIAPTTYISSNTAEEFKIGYLDGAVLDRDIAFAPTSSSDNSNGAQIAVTLKKGTNAIMIKNQQDWSAGKTYTYYLHYTFVVGENSAPTGETFTKATIPFRIHPKDTFIATLITDFTGQSLTAQSDKPLYVTNVGLSSNSKTLLSSYGLAFNKWQLCTSTGAGVSSVSFSESITLGANSTELTKVIQTVNDGGYIVPTFKSVTTGRTGEENNYPIVIYGKNNAFKSFSHITADQTIKNWIQNQGNKGGATNLVGTVGGYGCFGNITKTDSDKAVYLGWLESSSWKKGNDYNLRTYYGKKVADKKRTESSASSKKMTEFSTAGLISAKNCLIQQFSDYNIYEYRGKNKDNTNKWPLLFK